MAEKVIEGEILHACGIVAARPQNPVRQQIVGILSQFAGGEDVHPMIEKPRFHEPEKDCAPQFKAGIEAFEQEESPKVREGTLTAASLEAGDGMSCPWEKG